MEYLSQSNHSADCVNPDDRYKFVDDLTTLEIINLLTIGLSSLNIKSHVPSDIPQHNQFINSDNLKSQHYLNTISEWTDKQKMVINEKKTKCMIFNFSKKYQFSTRLLLKNTNLEVINKTKLLGTIITNDLKWDENSKFLIKKANMRLELLRRAANFKPSVEDLKQIYIIFIKSILEQSSVVWQSGITHEQRQDFERIQKNSCKIILKNKYQNYEKALNLLNLEKLGDRRRTLSEKFAKGCLNNDKMRNLFPQNNKEHSMKTRKTNKFKILKTNTERMERSPIVYMQKLLNTLEQ